MPFRMLVALDAGLHRFAFKSLLGFELRRDPRNMRASQDTWDIPCFASAVSLKPENPPHLRGSPRPE